MPHTRPSHLRVDHLDRPLGVHTLRPRLSWRLPHDARTQLAYRIEAGGWDTGRVDSEANTGIAYDGPEPGSAVRIPWRVKVWTDLGESAWSQPSWWETGLLAPHDWQAHWIEPAEAEPAAAGHRPAHLLRHTFSLTKPVRQARLYATAHGVYEAFLNGRRVGDMELTPGFTAYRSRLQVQTYDVTDLLVHGDNAVGAILSDGWFRGRHGFAREADGFGSRTGLLAQLTVTHHDGTTTVLGTGPAWRSTPGGIIAADLMDGQHTDLRVHAPRWAVADHDDRHWDKAQVAVGGLYDDFARLTGPLAPPVRRVEELTPVAVTAPAPGRHVVDLGQNINGWVRLSNLGPAGTRLTLVHGEALDTQGDVTTDNIRAFDWATRRPLPAGQIDTVVSAGRPGEVFEPRHTTHGFRYVRVEGHPGPLTPDDVRGVVVHTDLTRTGWFTSSDDRLNRLHEAAVWSLRGNMCDVPTDCPQRERAAWTGDWQVFAPTAAYLYDVAGFTAKWLRDLAADQWADGTVPNFVPDPADEQARRASAEGGMNGSAGWGDAAVIVPWEMWRAYGDLDVLRVQYPSMCAWVDFAAHQAYTRRHPDRAAVRHQAAPHEEHLWDTGFHFGEWLEPGVTPDLDPTRDHGAVATAYLHRSADLLARTAALVGHPADEARYRRVAEGARLAWQREYLADDGTVTPDTQATLVRALAFGLVPASLRARTADRLATLIRAAGTHLSTGFLSTGLLLPVLAETGHLGLAYELLLQDTAPSWLTMIDKGATTIWEDWEGTDGEGRPKMSYNHYSKGAVVSFLHQYVAGIRLPAAPIPGEAGYRRFVIAPQPGGGLTFASARLDSPHGRIASEWRLHDGQFTLTARVPPGTEAEIRLPGADVVTAGPGTHTYTIDMCHEDS
ncbi:family 78 glycoside hydrolase catalytic domain [Streptomyces justiciae]|uniref:family 78 glycoside hydrolase catalytic domain n=1 Tax=Streptomyces justiciae TaxID=2780140 RepID=UPI0021179D27|nr:family 78 glycoside hydrolase catalytic domain [Streptomyces justiciae]MCW8383561.1 glycoside hydrolase family 78 protein [Streptomyces justiciae]